MRLKFNHVSGINTQTGAKGINGAIMANFGLKE